MSSAPTRRGILIGLAIAAAAPRGIRAAERWTKATAFGVTFEVPAGWKRFDYRKPPGDHDEVQFAENARDISAGAWFSVFPTNRDLLDPDLTVQPTVIDGRRAAMTDMLTRADDPPPRRRQIVIVFDDSHAPAFLFDGNAEQWAELGPVLERILRSIRLPAQ
jgi:hypothetical protein